LDNQWFDEESPNDMFEVLVIITYGFAGRGDENGSSYLEFSA